MYFIDTHAHLDFSNYDHDRDEVIKRAHDEVYHILLILELTWSRVSAL